MMEKVGAKGHVTFGEGRLPADAKGFPAIRHGQEARR